MITTRQRIALLASALALVGMLILCACAHGKQTVILFRIPSTNVVVVTPAFSVSPVSFDFGKQCINVESDTVFVVSNTTSVAVSNISVTINDAPVTSDVFGFSLAPHAKSNINLASLSSSVRSNGGLIIFSTDNAGVHAAPLITTILAPPVAKEFFTITTNTPWVATFTFQPTTLTSPTNFNWDFGDGNTTNTTNSSVTHPYSSTPSTNNITFTVSGLCGQASTTEVALITIPPPSCVVPWASFTLSPTSGPAPLTVVLTSVSTGTLDHYQWYFGDGGGDGSSGPVTNSYAAAGTYNAQLSVNGPCGTSLATVVITATDTNETAAFISDGGSGSSNYFQTALGTGLAPANFAVEFWCNIQTNSDAELFRQGIYDGSDGNILLLRSGERLKVHLDGAGVEYWSSTNILTTGTWHHVALSVEGSTNAQIFIDGIRVYQNVVYNYTWNANNTYWYIGGQSLLQISTNYAVRIDDLILWNTAKYSYKSNFVAVCRTNNEAGMVARYNFNDVGGSNAVDSVGGRTLFIKPGTPSRDVGYTCTNGGFGLLNNPNPDEYMVQDSWENAKTKYSLAGNGVTDDTNGLSNMFANIGTGTVQIAYLPDGVYKVTNSLKMVSKSGVQIYAEHAGKAIIRASGTMAPDHFVLNVDGCPYARFHGLVLDAGGDTNITLVTQSKSSGTPFNTFAEWIDCTLSNAGRGLVFGDWGNDADAEASTRRCHFSDLQQGIYLGSYNTIGIWIDDSSFSNVVDAVTNTGVDGSGGAGNFNVSNSLFVNNTNDLRIGNTGIFSFTDNLSTNSGRFLLCGGTDASCQIVLLRNLVVDPKLSPCIDDQNNGQLTLLSNAFWTADATVVAATRGSNDFLAYANTFNAANPFSVTSKHIIIDNTTNATRGATGTITLSAAATNITRTVTNVADGSTAAQVQAAINAVTNSAYAIVHFNPGTLTVLNDTVTVPANTDIQLEGDGYNSHLGWSGGAGKPIFKLLSPSRAVVKNLRIEDGGRAGTTGLVVTATGQEVWTRHCLFNNSTDPTGANILILNSSNAVVTMLETEFGISSNGLFVNNSTADIRLRNTDTAPCLNVYTFTNSANVFQLAGWYEGNNEAVYARLSGAGTVSFLGGQASVDVSVGAKGAGVTASNWNGTAVFAAIGARDKFLPTSGSGSLLVNGVNFLNANPLTVGTVGLTTYGAYNCRYETNGVTTQVADSGLLNTNLIRAAFAQALRTIPAKNPSGTNAVLDSVTIDKCDVAFLVN
jgi:PKD repeat protein